MYTRLPTGLLFTNESLNEKNSRGGLRIKGINRTPSQEKLDGEGDGDVNASGDNGGNVVVQDSGITDQNTTSPNRDTTPSLTSEGLKFQVQYPLTLVRVGDPVEVHVKVDGLPDDVTALNPPFLVALINRPDKEIMQSKIDFENEKKEYILTFVVDSVGLYKSQISGHTRYKISDVELGRQI